MTTAATTARIVTYRKTKSGEWVVYGPAAVVRPGVLSVTKKSGETKTEQVERVGRAFMVDGQAMVYGYISRTTAQTQSPRHNGPACESCGYRYAHLATDMSGISGYACIRCDDGSLSFC